MYFPTSLSFFGEFHLCSQRAGLEWGQKFLCLSTNVSQVIFRLKIKIFPYSDGVGDGQLNMVKEYEIPQMRRACALLDANYDPGLTFIVVQKRINTRFFAVCDIHFYFFTQTQILAQIRK